MPEDRQQADRQLNFLGLHFCILQLYGSNKISPMGNSGCLPKRKPAATELCYPTYSACWEFKHFHDPLNSDVDYGIFNVCRDVNACNYCSWGCTLFLRKSALKVDWEKNPLPHQGIEPASAACRSDALIN